MTAKSSFVSNIPQVKSKYQLRKCIYQQVFEISLQFDIFPIKHSFSKALLLYSIMKNSRKTIIVLVIFLLCAATAFSYSFTSINNIKMSGLYSNMHQVAGRNSQKDASMFLPLCASKRTSKLTAEIRAEPSSTMTATTSSLLAMYDKCLQSNPYITKILSSGVVGCLGDSLIQLVTGKGFADFDVRRLLVFTTVSALYIAPVIHYWFNWLNAIKYPDNITPARKALYMTIIDQTVGALLVTSGFFYAFELVNSLTPPFTEQGSSTLFALLFNSAQSATASCRLLLIPTIVASWYCWPLINFINFLFIPLQYRLLFSNVAAVGWNMYLSQVANSSGP